MSQACNSRIGIQLIMVVILLMVLLHPIDLFGQRRWAGQYTSTITQPGYDGASASISYVEPEDVTDRVVVWAGVNACGNARWMQCGWGRTHGEPAKTYWEWMPTTGKSIKNFGELPNDFDVYSVFLWESPDLGVAAVSFWVGDSLEEQVPWSELSDHFMLEAFFGAEMHNSPDDHTPGGLDEPVVIEFLQVLEMGVWKTPSTIEHVTATWGNAVSNGNGYWIYDSRD